MIKIDELYSLEAEEHSWTLTKTENKGINPETGKDTVSITQTFHSNLINALNHYIDSVVKKASSIDELISLLKIALGTKERVLKNKLK